MLAFTGAKHNPDEEESAMRSAAQSPFKVTHGAWGGLRPTELGERIQLRHLRGGASQACWLTMGAGSKVSTPGVAAECIVTVIEGRLTCLVLGNEFQLLPTHHALIPPHVPFLLRAAGRTSATVLLHCSSTLPEWPELQAE
jgi:mannose-6-phosphate isomerase-like protein (cupin superfamily)